MTRTGHTIVRVDLAQNAQSSGWTGALVIVDEIVADSSIAARIRFALVDVEFTVLTLESLLADALVRSDQVFAVATVATRLTFALVDLLLAVRAGVTLLAVATM